MKRSPASWTTAIAASALLAMPVGTWAQQTSPQPTSPASSQTTASKPAGAQSSANEDLRKAEAALNDIPAASLTGAAKGRVAELKRHITALQRTSSAGKSSSGASAGKTSASTELAAADRILTELLGGEGTTGAAEPSAAGTSGKSASKAAPGVDDAAKAKLQEVRTHLTAFAASTGGGTPAPSPGAEDPSASASAAAAAAAASPSSAAPSATASTSTPQASQTSPSSQPPTASSPSPATTPTPTEPAAQAAQQQPEQQQPPSAASVDTDAVKRHLTAARESLSQLTQLPAAAQLTGESRTQVSQLISNFNELITTNSEWRASYAKVQANLNALVGDQRADESPAPAPTPGAAGAVGTSGTTGVDPTIRAKLVEFRTHLMDFEKAAGGGASASASPAASPATGAEPAAAAQPSTPATTPSTPAAQPTEPTPSPTPTTPAEPSPVGTSGRTSTPTPTGTTGTTPSAAPTTPTPSADQPAMQSEAMRHIEAIEAILNGGGTAGTAGSTASKPTAGSSSLDREQMEQIRTHLAALRKAISQSDKDK